ncbi:DUF3068 domain-containing protein [Actinocorallia populi]|uniref:DUF3068 domain-containing protein n=1 Tax=Actinocorallia populi TaxID=2079200 RepID=UPI000D08C897|nr:DUF3068 domain-containing protein [Actinocorallia populi]
MKRGGFLLVMLGAFFLAMAPLTRFYIADRVIAAPLDFGENLTLAASEASYFDRSKSKAVPSKELEARLNVGGDVRSGDDERLILNGILQLYSGDHPISLNEFRLALDRRTGQLHGTDDTHVDRNTEITQSGYWMMLPVANVRKDTYQLFDLVTGRTWPARFSGVEEVEGVSTYRFEQHVEPTMVGRSKEKVAPTVVGLPKKAKPVKIDRYYESKNTLWIDPRTGMPVKIRQDVDSTLRTDKGDEGTFVQADLVLQDKDVKTLAGLSEKYAGKIELVRDTLPMIFLAAGFVLLAAGGVLSMAGGSGVGRRGGADSGQEVERVPGRSGDPLTGSVNSK